MLDLKELAAELKRLNGYWQPPHSRNYTTWAAVPADLATKSCWLDRQFWDGVFHRVKRKARPVATVTEIYDVPRRKQQGVEAVPVEEITVLRRELVNGTLSCHDAARLQRAGQPPACEKLYYCRLLRWLICVAYADNFCLISVRFVPVEAQQWLGFFQWPAPLQFPCDFFGTGFEGAMTGLSSSFSLLWASDTEPYIAWVFIELGAAVLGLALLSRLAHRLGFSAIPLYLLGGFAFGSGGLRGRTPLSWPVWG